MSMSLKYLERGMILGKEILEMGNLNFTTRFIVKEANFRRAILFSGE